MHPATSIRSDNLQQADNPLLGVVLLSLLTRFGPQGSAGALPWGPPGQ